MPPLPRVLNKREASVTTRRVEKFLRKNFPDTPICFEVKVRGVPFEKHQIPNLKKAQRAGYYKKFRDDGSKQDFDGIWMPHPTSIVIWIEKNRKLTIEKVPE